MAIRKRRSSPPELEADAVKLVQSGRRQKLCTEGRGTAFRSAARAIASTLSHDATGNWLARSGSAPWRPTNRTWRRREVLPLDRICPRLTTGRKTEFW